MQETTIAAIATAPGAGGIAVVRLSGAESYPIAARVFRPANAAKKVEDAKGYTAMYGTFREGDEAFDEGVALFFRAPHSYTGEDVVELSCHGGSAVAIVLQDEVLKAQWVAELDEMRSRIKEMRRQFVDLLKEYGAEQDFSFIINQNGMFSFSGLTPEQVDRLKDEFAIYAVRSGRINVAGITAANIRYLCESIVKVL